MADWQVGDLALCVMEPISTNIRRGGIYRVKAVGPVIPFRQGDDVALEMEGVVNPMAAALVGRDWVMQRGFRKITPGHKIEGFEEPRRLPVKEKA